MTCRISKPSAPMCHCKNTTIIKRHASCINNWKRIPVGTNNRTNNPGQLKFYQTQNRKLNRCEGWASISLQTFLLKAFSSV